MPIHFFIFETGLGSVQKYRLPQELKRRVCAFPTERFDFYPISEVVDVLKSKRIFISKSSESDL